MPKLIQIFGQQKGWEFMPLMYIGGIISQPFCTQPLLEIEVFRPDSSRFWSSKGLGSYDPYIYRGYKFPTLLHPSPTWNRCFFAQINPDFWPTKGLGIYTPYIYRGYNFPTLLPLSPGWNMGFCAQINPDFGHQKGWEFMPPIYIGAIISQPFCTRALLEIGVYAQINPDFWPTKGLAIYAPYIYI